MRLVVAVGSLLLLSSAALAQPADAELRGTLLAEPGGEPIGRALVQLLDAHGQPIAATLSAADGSFLFREASPAGSGVRRVRVRRLGFGEWTSEPVAPPVPGAPPLRLRVPVEPVELEPLQVVQGRRCDSPLEEARRAYDLYRAMVRSLEPVVWTEREGLLRFRVRVTGTIRDRDGEKPDRETIHPKAARLIDTATVLVERPFASPRPEDLAERGYVRVVQDSLSVYFAPTASVLVSESFRETHCFGMREPAEGPGIGLSFRPVLDREAADVEGVVWLGPGAREVHSVEFRFTKLDEHVERHDLRVLRARYQREVHRRRRPEGLHLDVHPLRLEEERFGGRLDFDVLADGRRITRRWELRFPFLGAWARRFGEDHRGPTIELWPYADDVIRRGEVLAVLETGGGR